MLEDASLWLTAPTTVWPPGIPRTGKWLRRVLVYEARQPIGHIGITPTRWFPWPRGICIAAYEEPDASLLFTAIRIGWARSMTMVTEADGNLVAWAKGDSLACATRRLLAQRGSPHDWQSGRFLNSAKAEVARWERREGGTLIRFSDEVLNEPFVKMGVLAAISINLTS